MQCNQRAGWYKMGESYKGQTRTSTSGCRCQQVHPEEQGGLPGMWQRVQDAVRKALGFSWPRCQSIPCKIRLAHSTAPLLQGPFRGTVSSQEGSWYSRQSPVGHS